MKEKISQVMLLLRKACRMVEYQGSSELYFYITHVCMYECLHLKVGKIGRLSQREGYGRTMLYLYNRFRINSTKLKALFCQDLNISFLNISSFCHACPIQTMTIQYISQRYRNRTKTLQISILLYFLFLINYKFYSPT